MKGIIAIKIAVIGHIRHPIAPPFMGGMESHCYSLVSALENAGHDVTLFAAGSSDLDCFVPICDHSYENVLPWADWRGTERLAEYQRNAFAYAWSAIKRADFDVVHNNSLYPDLIDWARRDGIPMLTSQHVPPFSIMREAVERAANTDSQQFSVTSESQSRLWNRPGHSRQRNIQVVYNGVDMAAWNPAERRGDRMLWFGRITPTKGLRETVAAARIANISLDIVGTIEDEDYYHEYVAPFLGPRICYQGHLTGGELKRAVCEAQAVIVTPMWDEPFGLVAAEAMACDVPVIAFDRGAMREVLGNCGTLVPAGDVGALAAAMRGHAGRQHLGNRARVSAKFSLEAMVAGYESAYAAAVTGVAESAAFASNCSSTEALLA